MNFFWNAILLSLWSVLSMVYGAAGVVGMMPEWFLHA